MKNKLYHYFENYSIRMLVIVAILLNLFIESFARQSLVNGLKFLANSPLVFFYNALIIFTVILVSEVFRRKYFILIILCLLWIALGSANGIILSNRMTPFTVNDLKSFKDALSIATNYLSVPQMIAIGVGIVGGVFVIVLLWRKTPKRKDWTYFKKSAITVALGIAICMGTSFAAVETKTVDTIFPNLAYGYADNGVPYCFINTWLNTGVRKPKGYSKKQIEDIFTKKEQSLIKKDGIVAEGDKPNIIFVQLESLMDPLTLKDMEFNTDPLPTLRKLYAECSSGKTVQPSVGAGTANVEFEAMTGMSIRYFGPGEYPYKNIMRKRTVETIPYNLKQIGYKTHTLHNHRAVFYGRNEVFPNMGIDTFTSVEYMNNVSRTPKNWARDNVLTKVITQTLDSTKEPDYIYTVSVQGHGKYPAEEVLENPVVKVTKAPSESLKWQHEYFANQVYEMDMFVKDLIETLEKRDEKTVVVFYGDHVPAMENITDKNLKDGRSVYETDYCIWANFDMKPIKQDVHAYQIGAILLDRLGIHGGTITTLHQNHSNDKDYMENLHRLQYDMLYGRGYIYNGTNPWKRTNMRMGVADIKVTDVVTIGDKYYIKGENFTEYSKITLNGKILDTEYLGPTVLLLKEKVDSKDVPKMKISQVDKNEILSTSE